MQKAVYFDINALFNLLRGGRNILEVVESQRDFFTGSHVAMELIAAEEYLINKKIVKKRKLRGLLNSLVILPFSNEDAEVAGELIGKIKGDGKEITINEAMTAVQCYRRGLLLVTKNKKFSNLKTLIDLDIKLI